MRHLGNIIWILFFGLWSSFCYFLVGLFLCITIIGIPFGKQCFKIGTLVLAPFGIDIRIDFASHPFANIIWLFTVGTGMGVSYLVAGAICCLTIIGIPFGKQCFKLAQISLIPFGATF